ncbi:short-chain alcohol dehydrogenase-like protein [Hahella chejuensis KCTC 2396]|uniref:Short-chain alcohol dehydrogenase-like protein n=1 Tax=Hahella chejuensis (strain KCTC 2396) TaxID=349521 RepID=Q2SC03_HAHCH|nr:3-oxoacyl-ACP reductase [Hahella chejuensis]ABC31821.1 short-chain alcohol dehydrogenase-like protein [Hahella chejuensis KCTC 2396]
MSDLLLTLAAHPGANKLLKKLGLPAPVALQRSTQAIPDSPLQEATAVIGGVTGSEALDIVRARLQELGARVCEDKQTSEAPPDIALFDATGCRNSEDLDALYRFFHPLMAQFPRHGRALLLAQTPEQADDPVTAACAKAVEGFTRSLGKELGKRGATANLIYLTPGQEDRLAGPLTFFCSPASAYVDGQAIRLSAAVEAPPQTTLAQPQQNKIALVTGASRGIGAATARQLAGEGATVVCLDIPSASRALTSFAAEINGVPMPMDITAPDAPQTLAQFFLEQYGGLDIIVHNAGITRDKTLAKMSEATWRNVLDVNFRAVVAINEALLNAKVLRNMGRIICLSSISGVAGNFGQTNYAASKAALIGYVTALAPQLAHQGITVNAVAPAFIETDMTAQMPLLMREAGRRLNSLSQGGQPEDVAALIAFLAAPDAYGVTGATIRVCGQALIGA